MTGYKLWDIIGFKNERKKMQTVKTQLKNISDELLELYNTPGMALHFQPTNLKKLKEIIEKLIFLEEVIDVEKRS